ncbi:MAG: MoaD/ThiS family protein [Deltaproteobacteria bacterium]|nr:MoaD/ThiS family protein [Deltaproteobacteria bacterium]
MSIKVRLNMPLQNLAGGKERIEITGNTVRECLDDLIRRLPGAEKTIFDNSGYPIPLILVNNTYLPQGELDRDIKDGDELSIITMLFGG